MVIVGVLKISWAPFWLFSLSLTASWNEVNDGVENLLARRSGVLTCVVGSETSLAGSRTLRDSRHKVTEYCKGTIMVG